MSLLSLRERPVDRSRRAPWFTHGTDDISDAVTATLFTTHIHADVPVLFRKSLPRPEDVIRQYPNAVSAGYFAPLIRSWIWRQPRIGPLGIARVRMDRLLVNTYCHSHRELFRLDFRESDQSLEMNCTDDQQVSPTYFVRLPLVLSQTSTSHEFSSGDLAANGI